MVINEIVYGAVCNTDAENGTSLTKLLAAQSTFHGRSRDICREDNKQHDKKNDVLVIV